jgi:hypothetical protein
MPVMAWVNAQLSQSELGAAVTHQLDWIDRFYAVYSHSPSLVSGDIHFDEVLRPIRSLLFAFIAAPESDRLKKSLTDLTNFFGSVCIHRYSKLVLEKTVTDLLNATSSRSSFQSRLTVELAKVITAWCKYNESQLNTLLQVSKSALPRKPN